MGIRLKIGLGFAGLIIALTVLVGLWGARSLAITLEEADSEKLTSLRNQVLLSWVQQQHRLASCTRHIAESLALVFPLFHEREELLEITEKLRRHLSLDWLEIHDGQHSLLFPELPLAPVVLAPPGWPIRISSRSPLHQRGMLVSSCPVPGSTRQVVAGQRPQATSVDPTILWDEQGLLVGEREDFSHATLRSWENQPQTRQFLRNDRFYRIRSEQLAPGGPHLLYGYEASLISLTRTGVNELMLQIALLEVAGLLLLGFFLVRRLFAPLDRLRQGMELVARGKWQQLPATSAGSGNAHDEVEKVVATFNAMVQELAKAQENLIRVQQQLLHREKLAALGRFSAGIAHEINNPLGTILVSAGLAKDSLANGEPIELEDIEAIISETKRCRHIVDSLLQYAHNRPVLRQQVMLGPLVEQMCRNVLEQHAGFPVSLAVVADLQGIIVECDQIGLEQVMLNVLKNAMEALRESSSPQIKINVLTPHSDGFVKISVFDNGPGTDLDLLQAFEPLVTGKEDGTGLGLAISQAIIERHGGRIWMDRTSDGWTGLHFLVPLAHTALPAADASD